MAYAKVPLPCTDYPFGINDLNQLIANNDTLFTAITAEHGDVQPPSSLYWEEMGRHNGRLAAKTVVKLSPTVVGGSRYVEVLNGPTPVLAGVSSPSVGEVTVNLTGISRRRVIPMAEQVGSSAVRWVSLGWEQTSALSPIGVLLREDGVLADFPFYLVFWES